MVDSLLQDFSEARISTTLRFRYTQKDKSALNARKKKKRQMGEKTTSQRQCKNQITNKAEAHLFRSFTTKQDAVDFI